MPASITFLVVILRAVVSSAVQVPFLPNLTFVPLSSSNSITVTDRTCDQCLCDSNSSYSILKCFPNNSCQLFVDAPRSYELQPTPGALLYFPRQILPKASECWMPNISFLLNQLNTTTPTHADVPSPTCLLLDNHGYLVTVSQTNRPIVRFHPDNLSRIDQPPSPIFSQNPESITQYRGAYYVTFSDYILVVDSSNMSQIHNISAPSLSSPRDMIFLNDGQQMIVASTYGGTLVFFNRSSTMPHNYDFVDDLVVTCPIPHGLFYVNDTFFYLTSAQNNTAYSYSNAGNITSWTETLVLNAPSTATSPNNGWHVSIDSNDRFWFSMGTYGTEIFDSHGSSLGSLYATGHHIYDTLISKNYVIYLSDLALHQIIRIDPNLQC